MSMIIGILREAMEGEKRVALVPEVVRRLVAQGCKVLIEAGAGVNANYTDAAYQAVGGQIEGDRTSLLQQVQILLKVQPPTVSEIDTYREGTILIGYLQPHANPERVEKLRAKKITAFAMELLPRITRAQAMDVLSSQATVAGYRAALLAAYYSGGFFPMLTTAAGTIRPARVLVLGAGVAGLQAIATARRLGAIVEAYDVRRAAKEEVQSLGARFLEVAVDASAEGGYARELTEEEKKRQQELVAKHVAQADVVITTAQIPGKKAPCLVDASMVSQMKSGAVIIDLAAESGGNCALTSAGEVVEKNGVKIVGPINIASQLPTHASEMYAKNLFSFLSLLTNNGTTLSPDWNDEIIRGSNLTGGPQ